MVFRLGLTMLLWLVWNCIYQIGKLKKSTCLCLLSDGTKACTTLPGTGVNRSDLSDHSCS